MLRRGVFYVLFLALTAPGPSFAADWDPNTRNYDDADNQRWDNAGEPLFKKGDKVRGQFSVQRCLHNWELMVEAPGQVGGRDRFVIVDEDPETIAQLEKLLGDTVDAVMMIGGEGDPEYGTIGHTYPVRVESLEPNSTLINPSAEDLISIPEGDRFVIIGRVANVGPRKMFIVTANGEIVVDLSPTPVETSLDPRVEYAAKHPRVGDVIQTRVQKTAEGQQFMMGEPTYLVQAGATQRREYELERDRVKAVLERMERARQKRDPAHLRDLNERLHELRLTPAELQAREDIVAESVLDGQLIWIPNHSPVAENLYTWYGIKLLRMTRAELVAFAQNLAADKLDPQFQTGHDANDPIQLFGLLREANIPEKTIEEIAKKAIETRTNELRYPWNLKHIQDGILLGEAFEVLATHPTMDNLRVINKAVNDLNIVILRRENPEEAIIAVNQGLLKLAEVIHKSQFTIDEIETIRDLQFDLEPLKQALTRSPYYRDQNHVIRQLWRTLCDFGVVI